MNCFRFIVCLFLSLLAAMPAASAPPAAILELMKKHKLFQKQAGIVVWRTDDEKPLIAHESARRFNPASTIKIVTAFAAMDLLGADFRWQTSILHDGVIDGDVLRGNLYIVGGGDPLITVERFLLMANDLRARGIKKINGDVIVDDSLFLLPPHDPAAFDGAPLQPYNVGGGAMIVGWKSMRVVLSPHLNNKTTVFAEPPNAHVLINNKIRYGRGRCRNWRGNLRESWTRNGGDETLTLSGKFPRRCGEQSFYVSPNLTHAKYVGGVFAALWKRLGGELLGTSQTAKTPADAILISRHESPSLFSALVAMNKFSNNVIARNVFLSLGFSRRDFPSDGWTPEDAREVMNEWLAKKDIATDKVFVDNGSGLSRRTAISPMQLAMLMRRQRNHSLHSELLSSLPILGIDGTLKKRLREKSPAGDGHFKTGSLNGVKAIAGFMKDRQGREVLAVALIKSRHGANARNFQDALLEWIYDLP